MGKALRMQTIVDIGSLIWRRPGIRGGRPCVAGTGVSVMRIVGWPQLGIPPEKIAANYGHLSVPQVYAALAYYYANRAEIDEDIAAEEAAGEELEREIWERSRSTS
jgi:uncharacterized protein (DUF433 family)